MVGCFLFVEHAHAQVPHEFFKFRYLEPPLETDTRMTEIPVKLDANTRPPKKTTLEENFDPPIGAHKRVNIYQHIDYADDLIVLPHMDTWHRVQPASEHVQGDVLRRGLVYAPLQAETPFILPTDSSRMRIVAFHAFENDKPSKDLTLWWSEVSGRYAVTSEHPGTYRIELTSASSPKLLTEARADELREAERTALPDQPQMLAIRTLVQQYPELYAMAMADNSLDALVTWFRGFEAVALEPSSMTLLETILSQRRGVCRHRAMAFTAVAQAFGYKVRLVTNEAHAFVEVYIRDAWRFVDLGGQTEKLEVTSPFDAVPVAISERQVNVPSENTVQKAFFTFTAPPPRTYTRDIPITLEGTVLDIHGRPVPDLLITLGVDAPHLHTILTSAMTDAEGAVKFTFRLPPELQPGKASLWLLSEFWQIEF